MILPYFQGAGILEILMRNITENIQNVPVVMATTTNPSDDVLVEIAGSVGITVFRGSESNVLERFIQAARQFGIEKIIRICADNPFLDIFALKQLISQMEETDSDYWCYRTSENLPTIKTHYGFWAEGVSLEALEKVRELTSKPVYVEHVTNYIYTHPSLFEIRYNEIDPSVDQERSIRLTVDTENDFELSKTIYDQVLRHRIPVDSKSVVSFIKSRPEWLRSMEREIIANSK